MPDKILCNLTVESDEKSYSFVAEVDPKYLGEWLDDGLDFDLKENQTTPDMILCGLDISGNKKNWSFDV